METVLAGSPDNTMVLCPYCLEDRGKQTGRQARTASEQARGDRQRVRERQTDRQTKRGR